MQKEKGSASFQLVLAGILPASPSDHSGEAAEVAAHGTEVAEYGTNGGR